MADPTGYLAPKVARAATVAAAAMTAVWACALSAGAAADNKPASAPADQTEPASPGLPATQSARRLVNDMCPVMPEEFASPQHEVSFRGVAVRLCCRTCREKFTANPEKYVARLPHVRQASAAVPEPRTAAADAPLSERLLGSWWGPVNRAWRDYEGAYFRWRPLLCAALAVLVVHFISVRRAGRKPRGGDAAAVATEPGGPGGARGRLVALFARPMTALVAIEALVIVGLARETLRSQELVRAERAARESHEAVAKGAGRFAAELSRQALILGQERVRSLRGTYFRGNDERNAALFNGGIYETCRFETSIRTATGEQVSPGSAVAGKPLSVRIEIVRGPNTVDSLMNDDAMGWAFLAGRTVDPWLGMPRNLPLAIRFRGIEPDRRWLAEYPIGRAGESGVQKLEGVVLVCRGDPNPREGSASTSAHYALQYHLRVTDGRITPGESRLWMAPVYFSADLPDDQLWTWFSPVPLPTIPDGYVKDASLKQDDPAAGE